jgi:oligopeptidase A
MRNAMSDDNPDPYLPRFDTIRPERIVPVLKTLLDEYDRGLETHLESGTPGDWSLVAAETEWADRVARVWAPFSHLAAVADSEAVRTAHNEALVLLTEHSSRRQQDARLYRAYRQIASADAFSALTQAQQRVVELELEEFRLAGADLDDAARDRMREIMQRTATLGNTFSENVLDATQSWKRLFDDPSALSGLPESELQLLAGLARSHGAEGWMVDLSYPAFHAILSYADDRELRQQAYTAFMTRASDQGPDAGRWDNTPLIDELLALRHELAGLLGYGDYVEYALARRMASSADEVLDFLGQLVDLARPLAVSQLQKLQDYANDKGFEETLESWDVAYWAEHLLREELALSDEMLKPWFPLERMIEGLFDVVARLFGVRFEADTGVSVWHPDVRYYGLLDQHGERFAGVYMDFFARPEKRGGAWMDVCRSRRQTPDGIAPPVAFLNCNFAPPAKGRSSLLTHDDVETLFHEFGHCLHHLLTEVDWPQVNGITGVEWDAVELPSQLFENWCWNPEFLARFARHVDSGESIPEELTGRLLRSRTWMKGLQLARQLEYALADFKLHREYDPQAPADPVLVLDSVRTQVGVMTAPSFNRFLCGFGHIFGGGYAAGYYSYLWAEQLSADAWGRFGGSNVFDRLTGESLRQEILAVGASRPAMDSFVAFRGRKPEPGPLLELYGLPATALDH